MKVKVFQINTAMKIIEYEILSGKIHSKSICKKWKIYSNNSNLVTFATGV